MIGIHTYIITPPRQVSDYKEFNEMAEVLNKEEWHEVEVLAQSDYSKLLVTKHMSYPIHHWRVDDYLIVLEGAIYGESKEKVVGELTNIVKRGINDADVDGFVYSHDGDYIVLIKNQVKEDCYIFNDILGNIPLNYYYSETAFVASRSLSYIACGLKDLSVSKDNLVETLTLDFNLKDHTIFEKIYQTMPAQEIKCKCFDGNIQVEVRNTYDHCFETKNRYKSKKEAARDLAEKFLKGCQDRVQYAKENGYDIVNTMSGGFDSRTVLGGVERFVDSSQKYTNITYEYKQDESIVAKKMLDTIGTKSTYIKFSYENKVDYHNSRLSFITDGKINSYTNSICYNDLKYGYDNYFKNKRIMYFGGFGGEFIRHPFFSSAWNKGNIGRRFFSPTLQEARDVVGLKEVIDIFKSIDANNNEAYCRKFYSEYYTKFVRGAGEERMRMFYHTAQPLMAKDFILSARNRLPLSWCGFGFYKLFLSYINPKLTEVAIWGNRPKIDSTLSILLNDYRMKGYFINNIKFEIIRSRRKKTPLYAPDLLESYLNKLPKDIDYLNRDYLYENYDCLGGNFQNKIIAFLQYISMINQKRTQ